jgi:hypothetical protein
MKTLNFAIICCILLTGCQSEKAILKNGQAYQLQQEYRHLNKVVKAVRIGADTSFIKKVLGEPIDMGFDYRYLIDSMGPGGCVIGAVFHIDDKGKIDQKWIGEICE